MSGPIASRLKQLGITLPAPFAPPANFVPCTITGNLVYVSGQGPIVDDAVAVQGKLGRDVSVEEGQRAARLTALQLLAAIQLGVPDGGIERVRRVVKLFGLVNCTPDFTQQPQVMNGASDLMVEVFGEAGKHARVAIGAQALPVDCAVEIDGIFEIA